MMALWDRTFQLFRSHLILWVPCSVAAILMLVLSRLEKAWIYWLFEFFLTQRSVLGGRVQSADIVGAQHRAMMMVYPIGFLKQFLEVCFFVAAFFMTKELVCMILEDRRPEMMAAVRNIAPRYRAILIFSTKYMVLLGVLGFAPLALLASPLMPGHIHEIVVSKIFIYSYSLLAEAWLAWLLVPAAIALLRPPGALITSNQERRLGTICAVATSAISLVIQYSVGRFQTAFVIDTRWQEWALASVSTVLVNAPEVMLFIALALLAIQNFRQENVIAAEPELS